MGSWGKKQTGIRQQDHWRSQPITMATNPVQAFKREPRTYGIPGQERTSHAEPDCSDIPRCEACPQAEAGHDDETGPDAYGSDAVERAADVFGSRRVLHGS